jgi:branched-subunit amino acid transport protein
MNDGTDLWTMLVIVGLAGVTVLTRCFFFILDKSWSLPSWAERALQYAPVAALAGVIAPEVVMQSGHLIATWRDARLFAAPVSALLFYWRRSMPLTIFAGMAVYLVLHLELGW